jgi:SAM-dependent methyltransferase
MSIKPSNETNNHDDVAHTFSECFASAIEAGQFARLVLSNPKNSEEKKVIVSQFVSRGDLKLTFDSRFETKSISKTRTPIEAARFIKEEVGSNFRNATLFTSKNNFSFSTNKKGKARITKNKPSMAAVQDASHNRKKSYLVSQDAQFLRELGVSDRDGNVTPKMYGKFRQITKFVEIVDQFIKGGCLDPKANIRFMDVGCGKGYLTFAVFEYLSNKWPNAVDAIGIDIKDDLVSFCNGVTDKLGHSSLRFEATNVEALKSDAIDILVALHACDTATDHAIFQGIKSGASLIFAAPCCQHEIASQVRTVKLKNPLLQKGLFLEKQADLVTDVARTLLLESCGYKVKVVEFVSSEHSMKNTLIVAEKRRDKTRGNLSEYLGLKKTFGFHRHSLEDLLLQEKLIELSQEKN